MKLGLHIIENPSSTFSFASNVPIELAFVNKDGTICSSDVVNNQMMLPSKYRSIKNRTFKTKEEAINTAKKLGYNI